MAGYRLTQRLIPLLRRSAPARIVNVASVRQYQIDFDNLMLTQSYDGLRAYRQSKLAQVMFTFDLAEHLRGSGIAVNCLHPATLMNTNMVLESGFFGGPQITIEEGARGVEYIATTTELEGLTGLYFEGLRPGRAYPQAYDKEAQPWLRILSAQLIKPKETNPDARYSYGSEVSNQRGT
jgi:NAD(P)-dependent dehydrogenase (short-subunit alcohol dehydrogenase family)